VPGRSGTVLAQWIHAQPEPWRDQITVAALDPFRGYATALRTALPGANSPDFCSTNANASTSRAWIGTSVDVTDVAEDRRHPTR